jgi:hypothetical protein
MDFGLHSEDELATKIIGVAIDVHTKLGPGLLENAYKQVMTRKLQNAGFFIEVEKALPIEVDDIRIAMAIKSIFSWKGNWSWNLSRWRGSPIFTWPRR